MKNYFIGLRELSLKGPETDFPEVGLVKILVIN